MQQADLKVIIRFSFKSDWLGLQIPRKYKEEIKI